MKKIILIFLPLFIIVFAFLFSDFSLERFVEASNEKNKTSFLNLGFVKENYESNNYKKYTSDNIVVGECVCLNLKNFSLNQIANKLGLVVTKKYYVDELMIIEGVSAKLKYAINDRRENVQIAINGDNVVVASPIIYGSY